MDIVSAFVRVDGLEVHDVPDDVVLVGDSIAAQHVAARAGNVQRFAARVALQQRNHFRSGPIQTENTSVRVLLEPNRSKNNLHGNIEISK